MNQQMTRKIFKEIDKRSYDLMKAAERFGGGHSILTSNQASGLAVSADCVDNPNTLITHIQNQSTKSTVREKDRGFWRDLKKEIEALRGEAEQVFVALEPPPDTTDKARKEAIQYIQLLLARDYIQHLSMHEVYARALQKHQEEDYGNGA